MPHDRIGVEILTAAFSSPELTDDRRPTTTPGTAAAPTRPTLRRGDDIPLGGPHPDDRRRLRRDGFRPRLSQGAQLATRRSPSCAAAPASSSIPGWSKNSSCWSSCDPARRRFRRRKQSALRLGIQMERMAAALDSHDYECLATMAHGLAQVAEAEGSDRIAAIAAQLRDAAKDEPEMLQLVSLTNELLGLCRAAQTTALAEADEA